MEKGKLGILGGMGPQATQVLYQRVLDYTDANTDQEHIPTLIVSDTQIPDRTQAILSGDTGPVLERLREDAKLLEAWGVAVIAVPCNTSHALLPQVQASVETPIIDMIAQTAGELKRGGARRVGILATDGNLRSGLYQTACARLGMEAVSPPPQIQRLVMSIIYDEIKKGERGSREKFAQVNAALKSLGCDRAVLACTELSVYKDWHHLSDFYLDAMDVLALRCVEGCGYPVRNV